MENFGLELRTFLQLCKEKDVHNCKYAQNKLKTSLKNETDSFLINIVKVEML